jgi:hypothetical protein
LAILLGGVVFIYRFVLSPRTKLDLNLAVAPLGVRITPWSDRAEAVVRATCERGGAEIARAIVQATHPTGEDASLSSVSFSREGEIVACTLQVSWYGRVLHTHYLSTVVWRISEQGHMSASLVRDSAQITASPGTAAALEDYFKSHVWPEVAKQMGLTASA